MFLAIKMTTLWACPEDWWRSDRKTWPVMEHHQTIDLRGFDPLALVKRMWRLSRTHRTCDHHLKRVQKGSWMDTPKDRTPGSGHRGLVMISKSGSQDPTMIMMVWDHDLEVWHPKSTTPDHGFGRSGQVLPRSLPRSTTMSEGLTDQSPVNGDSWYVPSCPAGCLDTCFGPHKRWSKKGPKIGRFEGGRSRGLEGRYPKVVPK